MASRLWSWITGGSREVVAARPARPVAPAESAQAPAPNVAAAPALTSGAPESPPASSDPAVELRRRLDQDIADELAALDGALAPVLKVGDPGTLLRDLSGDVATAVRRPPVAAQQALMSCRDPNASLAVILETFHHDPALTQKLLSHANSPFYATGGGAATSLHDAAQRVGTSGLHAVLMTAMVEGLLCRPGPEYEAMAQKVWTHMVRTAPIARLLGRTVGLPPETCYTLGLLHDLGKLIVFDRLSALRTSGRQTLKLPRPFLSEVLTRLHGPIGGVAALAWNLDVESARAIAAHPRTSYRRYQDSWYGQLGVTLEESEGERISQVLALAEWWDLATIRGQAKDFETFWARSGLTLPIDDCSLALLQHA